MTRLPFPLLSFFEGKKCLLLTHAGADVDSLASASAFFFSLKDRKNAAIGVLDHANLSARALAKNLSIPFKVNPPFGLFDCIVAFDFNDLEMAGTQKGALENFSGQVFVFDHHKKTGNPVGGAKNSLVDEKAVSTTEVVFGWLEKSRAKISPVVASCIACGIIVDSAGFHVADAGTFQIMAQVVGKSRKTFSGLVSLFEVKRDISESIAKLKAARRVRIFKSFDHLIVFSDVGSFESSAAMAFVFLGASVAFAGDGADGKVLISGRAKSSVVERTGFDLVKHVFVPLEKKFSGRGGGHAGAAAFNGNSGDVLAVLKECVKLVHGFFQEAYKKNAALKEYS